MKTLLIKNKYKIFLFIFIVNLIVSIALTIENPQEICSAEKGCNAIQNSKYASTFSIKNSDYGVVIFSFLALITLAQIYKPTKNKEKIINLSIIIGAIISIYFIYLQQFVLKAYCKYCLIVDIILILTFILLIATYQDASKNIRHLEHAQELKHTSHLAKSS